MSERKSINKYRGNDYYEEDFAKLRKKLKKSQKGDKRANVQDVRLMAPFSLKCLNCNEYIAKSRKFNAKKETTDQTYLGIRIYRFTIRCPRCANSIQYRTDPKTADYITESGAVRNYVSQNNQAQELKDETLEETLERLEKEEKEAKELEERKAKSKLDGIDGDDESTMVEKLEKKLEQNAKEQQLNEEIDSLLSKNTRVEKKMYENTTSINDDDIEKMAKEAFKNHSQTKSQSPPVKVQLISRPSKVTKLIKRKKKVVI